MKEKQLKFIYGQIVRQGTINYDFLKTVELWDEISEDEWIITDYQHITMLKRVSNWLENDTTDYDVIDEFIN